MKQKLWITLATCLAYCIDKEFYKAIDYLLEQVRALVEQQENRMQPVYDRKDYATQNASQHQLSVVYAKR